MSTYTVETIVRSYHVYRAIWEAAVGQVLPCQQERGNAHDPYAIDDGLLRTLYLASLVPRQDT